EGHSALVFSSFTSMLDLLAERLTKEGIGFFTITGKTSVSQRSKLVNEFNNSPNNEMFLLSLKAAGTGLTLTKADYVFIFDPWWNPAAEAQAIDRTHRIGQDKPVIAYKMVAEDSIEEQILFLQEQKRQLFDQLVTDTDSVPQQINSEFINKLLNFE
ncbi:MAG: DEAD/DEAH box helicase, partial [Lentisphaeria bacterium]